MQRTTRQISLGLALFTLACGGDERAEMTGGDAGGVSLSDGGIDPGDAGSDSDDESSGGSDSGVDPTGPDPTAAGDEGGSDAGCRAVDLLFVIDNSGSMEDEQANLISSFPGFIGAMKDQLSEDLGYHVGITSSDLYPGNFDCPQEGALITQTAGGGASNAACGPYASGARYMTESDDLNARFSCAAQVGIEGDGDERPMQTMLAALSDSMTGPGGCNEGFLRDDALLVVVIITDEEDDHETMGCTGMVNTTPSDGSAGEPDQWFDQLVAVKGGDERKVVVLSLVGPQGLAACPELQKCEGGIEGAEVAHRIIDFTQRFTYGFVGPVCEPYGPFFSDAISSIVNACDDFTPVG
ncbi:MAG: hypothetical protein ACE37F_31645 [Nannocystaceae bacterium]|nr:hypothetical protein [bacterium]